MRAKFNAREMRNKELIAKLKSREILIPSPKKSILAEIMKFTTKMIIIFFLVDFIVFAKIDFFGGGFKISRDFNFANSSLVRISRTLNFANFREFCLISRINAREI